MKTVTLPVTAQVHGEAKAKIGLLLIRLGAWFCRDFRVSVKVNGVEKTSYHPHADVRLTLTRR